MKVLSQFFFAAACGLILLFAQSVGAQPTGTADKILAVIGRNRIILQSEFEQTVQQAQAQNPEMKMGDSLRCLILQEMISGKMLVEQAERDSLLVTDEEVDGTLENRIRYFIDQYGSKEKLEEVSGKTIYQMKEEYRDIIKEQMMAEKVKSKLLSSVRVTPVEVQTFFNQQAKDSLPLFPATIEVGQIVMAPPTNPELDALAKQKIEDIRNQIVKDGKSFETMAGLYSEDPGSRNNGGRYNDISRESGFVKEFVQAAFKLQNGEISPVVKTAFGYHIIQMVQRKGEQVDLRHILISPQHTDADYKASMERLDSVRAQIIAGKLSFGEAVSKYSTDEQGKMTGGMIVNPRTNATQLLVDELDPQLALMIDSLKIGNVSQPHVFQDARGKVSTRIVMVRSRTEPHRANLRDDYAKIQAVAKGQKEQQKMEAWIAERLPTYYLKIDPDYAGCPVLQKWTAQAASQ